jgi:hypothetical protein
LLIPSENIIKFSHRLSTFKNRITARTRR